MGDIGTEDPEIEVLPTQEPAEPATPAPAEPAGEPVGKQVRE